MKVAKFYNFHNIRIEQMPIPEIKEGELLVKAEASGICSGDIVPWYMEKKAPLVIGHEVAGRVCEVGAGVHGFQKGDRVVLHHHAPCMECDLCRRNFYSACATWKSTNLDPGAMSEYIRVPAINVRNDTQPLPDELSFEQGAMVEPIATCVTAMERMRIQKGDRLAVLGLGVMGVMNLAVAKHYGAEQIIGIDCVPYRLNKALEIGARVIDFEKEDVIKRIAELTHGEMVNKILVGPGKVSAMESAWKIVSAGGVICLFSPTQNDECWSIAPDRIYYEGLSIVGSYSCGPDQMKRALEIVASQDPRFPIETLVTHRFPLDEFPKAYRLMAAAGESLKVMIHFPEA